MRADRRPVLLSVLAGLFAGFVVPAGLPGTALAAPCDAPANEIVAENCLPGNPSSEWDVSGSGSASIQGFATEISVDQGQTVTFKIDTVSTDYRLDIYRMGYYAGMGARRVATVQPSAILPQPQPACLNEATTGLVDCGNWIASASWSVPVTATSGIYFAKLVREDGQTGASHIVFIVRDDDGGSEMLFQTSDTTWQAYNSYGGNSLYQGSPAGRAYKVSYNRPFNSRASTPEDWVFNAEYPMVRWLERNGYDVSYFTGVDTDRRGSEILEHDVFLSLGHDEYWSGGQRAAVEAARDSGVDLAFFSGNEVFWKTRWESSIDGSNTPYRTLVSYKETHADAKIDPLPNVWTGTWRDPRFSPPADGGRPENGLTGTIFTVNCCTYAIQVPEPDGKMRLWRDTSIAGLGAGQTATLSSGTLGYEWDEDLDNGFRPAGLFHMSSTTIDVPQRILDYGSTYGPGRATHHLTLYRDPNGVGEDALVFGAGTVQWSWGLDGNHDRGASTPDARMQQATVNLFADMGVQPATLQAGLLAANASTDTTTPTSAVTSPADGASVESGAQVVVTGSASDIGGGLVGGVEVSTDGGASWHPATGRGTWTYMWTPTAAGSTTVRSRAVDDSGNLEDPAAGVDVTVTAQSCPCSLWSDSTPPPAEPLNNDGQGGIEVGLRFRADVDGMITGLRFYKGVGTTGTHVGHLWTNVGVQLAEAAFTGETASGWQEVTLSTPVAITANTTYLVSSHSSSGDYAADNLYFSSAFTRPPLTALADGADGPNGVYRYGVSGFPTETFQANNYWLDVVFEPVTTADVFVTVSDTRFRPRTATAQQGDTVQWDFTGGTHSATDPSGMGLFDSGPRTAGESYQFTFTTAGRYSVDDTFSTNAGIVSVPLQVAPASGTTATTFTVTWGSVPLSGGFQADVQVRRPGSTRWSNWMVNQTTATSAGFTPDVGAGTYQFRARLENSGGVSRWSTIVSIIVS